MDTIGTTPAPRRKIRWIILAFILVTVAAVATAAVIRSIRAYRTSPRAVLGFDPARLPADFPEAIRAVRTAQAAADRKRQAKSTPAPQASPVGRDVLEKSYDLCSAFLCHNQSPRGNFYYEYDWLTKKFSPEDNQVRQAGALWAVSLCHRYRPTPDTRKVLDRGFKFYFDRTIPGPGNSLLYRYGRDKATYSGSVALVALAMIEFLRSDPAIEDDYRATLTRHLDGYLAFLQYLQLDNGHFAEKYFLETGTRSDKWAGYYDGETLLCLVKAARHMKHDELLPAVRKSARAMAEYYTVDSWSRQPVSRDTISFYQWGSMAYGEYIDAGWPDADLYAEVTLALASWMVHTKKIVKTPGNTAYALEGLITAYRIAKARNDPMAPELFRVIDTILGRIITWQVGGPLAGQNAFLKENPTIDFIAIGGFMNAADKAPIRIDVNQHQSHALILALESAYP